MTREHIVPLSKGGLNTDENIVPACYRCNIRKSTHSLLAFAGIAA